MAARLSGPGVPDANQRHRLGVEAKSPSGRVADHVRVTAGERLERHGKVRIAQDLQLLAAHVAGDEGCRGRRRLSDVRDPCSCAGDGRRGL